MTLTHRPYAGLQDLEAIKTVITAWKQVHPHSGIHRGDLDWWVFYDPSGSLPEDKLRLWERDGRVIGWTYTNPEKCDFDMGLLPDYRASAEEGQIIDVMIAYVTEIAHSKPPKIDPDTGQPEPRTITAFADAGEITRLAHFERHGLTGSDDLVCFAQDLRRDLPEPRLPEGFRFLDRMDVQYADQRGDTHFDAFSPGSRMTGEFYRQFMTSAPDYDPTLDIVAVAPDGRFASFAMAWVDTALRMSVFEPVGTRHEFHRRGLGRATLLEGLRRLKARGVEIACVNTGADEDGNIAFYKSAGFTIVNTVKAYEKEV